MVKVILTTKKGIVDRVLAKFSLILFGVLATTVIFAICSKYLGVWGIWLGIFITGGLVFCGFYYIEKGTRLRVITWSILITVIFILMVFTIGLTLLSKMFQ